MDKELEKVYKGLTWSDLEVQYMLRKTRPGYEEKEVPVGWNNRSFFEPKLMAGLTSPMDRGHVTNWIYLLQRDYQLDLFFTSMVAIGNVATNQFIALLLSLLLDAAILSR